MIDSNNKKLKSKSLPPAWRNALASLDAAFNKNTPHDNRELIDLFGKAHFGDLWDLRPRDPQPEELK